MNINSQAPDFRLPCFLKGSLQYVPLRDFQGHPIILCCRHTIEEQDAWALEAHATELVKSGWTLALLLSHPFLYSGSWSRPLQEFDLAIFTDPLKRFCRALNLFHHFQSRRCETLIFDHQIHLQFRLIHMISTGKDYHPFWKSQKNDLFHHVPIPHLHHSISFNHSFSFTSELRTQDQPRPKETGPHELSPDSFEICA